MKFFLRTRGVIHIITIILLARECPSGPPGWVSGEKAADTLWVSAQPTCSQHCFPHPWGWGAHPAALLDVSLNQGSLHDPGLASKTLSWELGIFLNSHSSQSGQVLELRA